MGLKSAFLSFFLMLLLPGVASAAEAAFQEGVHYERLAQPVKTQFPEKVEVVELFGYWCPHCDRLEHLLGPWKKNLDPVIDFKHMPVVFRPNQEEFAKAFYLAEALGVQDEVHPALFDLIHRQRRWIDSRQQLQEFFADFGVSEEAFSKAYNSFGIRSQVNLGRVKAKNYGIRGVPSLVVNGKYLVTAEKAGSQKKMLEVVDFLVEKEKSAM